MQFSNTASYRIGLLNDLDHLPPYCHATGKTKNVRIAICAIT